MDGGSDGGELRAYIYMIDALTNHKRQGPGPFVMYTNIDLQKRSIIDESMDFTNKLKKKKKKKNRQQTDRIQANSSRIKINRTAVTLNCSKN